METLAAPVTQPLRPRERRSIVERLHEQIDKLGRFEAAELPAAPGGRWTIYAIPIENRVCVISRESQPLSAELSYELWIRDELGVHGPDIQRYTPVPLPKRELARLFDRCCAHETRTEPPPRFMNDHALVAEQLSELNLPSVSRSLTP